MATDSLARALALQAPRTLGQSAVAVPHTGDTALFTTDTITIPANAMGINGLIEVKAQFTYPTSANNKTMTIKFGGSTVYTLVQASGTILLVTATIFNRASPSVQQLSGYAFASSTLSQTAPTAGAIDTTAPADITITTQLALGTETIIREWVRVTVYPKG